MSVFITSPTAVTENILARIKQHIRVTNTASDLLLQELYIPSAISLFEQQTCRALLNQTVKQVFDQFPYDQDHFLLERFPLQGSPSLTLSYYNESNTLTTVSTDNYGYVADSVPALIHLNANYDWPTDLHETRPRAVEVSYNAGYGTDLSDLPEQIVHTLAMIVGDMFNFRESQLYSAGGVLSESLSINSKRLMAYYKTGFYEWRSQGRRSRSVR